VFAVFASPGRLGGPADENNPKESSGNHWFGPSSIWSAGALLSESWLGSNKFSKSPFSDRKNASDSIHRIQLGKLAFSSATS
jgi:hypothetical protein